MHKITNETNRLLLLHCMYLCHGYGKCDEQLFEMYFEGAFYFICQFKGEWSYYVKKFKFSGYFKSKLLTKQNVQLSNSLVKTLNFFGHNSKPRICEVPTSRGCVS